MTKATRRWSQGELAALQRVRNAILPNASAATKAAAVRSPEQPLRGDGHYGYGTTPAQRKSRAKKPTTPERDILAACLQLLAVHPKVAWAERMNTGAMKLDDRYVKFGFPGLSDIIGQLTTGQMLAVECKRAGRRPTADQNRFLFVVNNSGGFACWVDSVDRLAVLLVALP